MAKEIARPWRRGNRVILAEFETSTRNQRRDGPAAVDGERHRVCNGKVNGLARDLTLHGPDRHLWPMRAQDQIVISRSLQQQYGVAVRKVGACYLKSDRFASGKRDSGLAREPAALGYNLQAQFPVSLNGVRCHEIG